MSVQPNRPISTNRISLATEEPDHRNPSLARRDAQTKMSTAHGTEAKIQEFETHPSKHVRAVYRLLKQANAHLIAIAAVYDEIMRYGAECVRNRP